MDFLSFEMSHWILIVFLVPLEETVLVVSQGTSQLENNPYTYFLDFKRKTSCTVGPAVQKSFKLNNGGARHMFD